MGSQPQIHSFSCIRNRRIQAKRANFRLRIHEQNTWRKVASPEIAPYPAKSCETGIVAKLGNSTLNNRRLANQGTLPILKSCQSMRTLLNYTRFKIFNVFFFNFRHAVLPVDFLLMNLSWMRRPQKNSQMPNFRLVTNSVTDSGRKTNLTLSNLMLTTIDQIFGMCPKVTGLF